MRTLLRGGHGGDTAADQVTRTAPARYARCVTPFKSNILQSFVSYRSTSMAEDTLKRDREDEEQQGAPDVSKAGDGTKDEEDMVGPMLPPAAKKRKVVQTSTAMFYLAYMGISKTSGNVCRLWSMNRLTWMHYLAHRCMREASCTETP